MVPLFSLCLRAALLSQPNHTKTPPATACCSMGSSERPTGQMEGLLPGAGAFYLGCGAGGPVTFSRGTGRSKRATIFEDDEEIPMGGVFEESRVYMMCLSVCLRKGKCLSRPETSALRAAAWIAPAGRH